AAGPEHRRPPLREGDEPPPAGAHPRHAPAAQGEPRRDRPDDGHEPRDDLLPRALPAPARADRARRRDAPARRGRAPLQGALEARDHRRGVVAGAADRQAGGGRLDTADDRRARGRVGGRGRLRPLGRRARARRGPGRRQGLERPLRRVRGVPGGDPPHRVRGGRAHRRRPACRRRRGRRGGLHALRGGQRVPGARVERPRRRRRRRRL
ncbi:MAG: hypothetical protein AVDCRST_MAG30-1094, partial [uncultured Solirubrobacteraceae bacterium]